MGAASKFIVLLAAPLPVLLLRPRSSLVLLSRHSPLSSCIRRHHHHLASSPLASNHTLVGIGFSVKASRRFHNLPAGLSDDHFSDPSPNGHSSSQPGPFSWSQWSRFHECLSSEGYYDHRRFPVPDGIVFACVGNIPEHVMQATRSCLALAHNRPDLLGYLSGGYIEVVISNCSPFLFEDAADTTRRMKSFLSSGRNNINLGALESEKASTLDLMKFLVSYMNNPNQSMEKTDADNKELIQSSVQNILSELVEVIPVTIPIPNRQNIEMKRGDWICPRCEFMNFARNVKCLECEDPRPPRQLTGGEWECPQCDFFNYGRNMVCLRCDCKRPGEIGRKAPSSNNFGNDRGISEGNGASDVNKNLDMTISKRLDEVLGRTYSAPNTVNKRTSASGTNTSPTQPGNPGGSNSSFVPFTQKSGESKAHESELEGTNSFEPVLSKADKQGPVSGQGDNRFVISNRDQSLVSPRDTRQADTGQENRNNHVPFVPFPPDYFAKKDKPAVDGNGMDSSETASGKFGSQHTDSVSPPDGNGVQWRGETQQMGRSGQTWGQQTNGSENASGSSSVRGGSMNNENVRPTTPSWTGKSLEGSAVKEPDPLDMSEEAKAERFFRRAAQIKDISELSQIPDEDFPSIMPMRKGVNRFVVSKRKTPMERRLTSAQYRRNLPVVSSDSVKKENEDS